MGTSDKKKAVKLVSSITTMSSEDYRPKNRWTFKATSTSMTFTPSPAEGPASMSQMQRQRQMRRFVAEILAEVPTLEFNSSDKSVQIFQQGTSFRSDSVAEFGFKTLCPPPIEDIGEAEQDRKKAQTASRRTLWRKPFRLKVGNASLKRLLSGAFAGAISRTVVAPLETIRTHLMVGSGGQTVTDVFQHIMETEGWQGLFRGNGINVIRVAPSKAIELFAYDTVKKLLTPKPGELSSIPFPISSVAGASAGVCSTLCTYPLELLKTRLTIQRGVYDNLFDAFVKICQEEGPRELYRGLTPSLIGVVPYAATNYFAYDTLRKLYRKMTKQQQIGNLATLFIGSAAGAIASAATFPLEVARKQMQVGALSGRPAYSNVLHALSSVLEQQGPAGLYRGLGASCMKLMPAAGISFMCYEACKRILIEEES